MDFTKVVEKAIQGIQIILEEEVVNIEKAYKHATGEPVAITCGVTLTPTKGTPSDIDLDIKVSFVESKVKRGIKTFVLDQPELPLADPNGEAMLLLNHTAVDAV